MKKILLVIISIFVFNAVFAQYKTLFTSVININYFKKIPYLSHNYDDIYFQPGGLSGTPCSVMDPYNSNIYRLNGWMEIYYIPFNGLLNRQICNDINGGCYPVGYNIFDASAYDTSWIIGYRKIDANPSSINCNQLSYQTIMSTNGGFTYNEIFPGKEIKGISLLHTRSTAIVGIDSHIYKSTNMGESFTKMGFVPGLQKPITINYAKPYVIFAGGEKNMYRSIDSGHTFSEMEVPVLKDIVIDNSYPADYYGVTNSEVYKGNSFGFSWTLLASIPNINCIEFSYDLINKKIFIGTNDGFYVSTNSGIDFRKSGIVFPESNKIIGISKYSVGDTLIICTEKSIHKVWDLQVGINQNSNTIPSVFKMHQNYPNPFNPTTNIKFDLPEKASVSLVIFDITGKEVSELVNTSLTAGEYTYTWDAFNLPSGIYFARISAESSSGILFSESKRLILLK
jgi:hypothetical protein